MVSKNKIACIGAGGSGVGHMVQLEKFSPGCIAAFSDIDRSYFDNTVAGILSSAGNMLGDFAGSDFELREDFKNLPYYEDVDEMFHKEDIDTAIIATYCCSHAEMVEKCVKYNVNILLEKPIAITEEEVEKIWSLLKNYDKAVAVNFTMRGAPVTLAAIDHVQNGEIGDIVSVQYVNNVHYGDGYFRKWMRTREKIGSLFLQKATHDFDVINSIIKLKPVSIAAFGSRLVYGGDKPNDLTCDTCELKWSCPMSIYRRNVEAARAMPASHKRKCVYADEIDIDDNQVVIIQYQGGVNVSYSQSFNAPAQGGQRGGYFLGKKGIMNLRYYGDFIENPSGEIIIGNSKIDITKTDQKPGTNISETYDWAGGGHFDGNDNVMRAKLAMLHGKYDRSAGTIEEGYVSAKMCIGAQESVETGKTIKLDLDL